MNVPRLAGICLLSLGCSTAVFAQDALEPAVPTSAIDGPTRLPDALPESSNALPAVPFPNLLRPPPTPQANPPAVAPAPRRGDDGPTIGRYDHGLLYLPDYVPPSPRRANCPCGPDGRFWLNASLFYGTIQNEDIPPLLTAGGSTIVGDPGVSVLGQEDRNAGFFRPGFLLDGGIWLNECQTVALEGSFLLLESNRAPFDVYSYGTPSLGRSFLDAITGDPGSELVAVPGVYAGSVSLVTQSQLIGAEANVRENIMCRKPWRLDTLLGYRFLRLSEALEIHSNRIALTDFADGAIGSREVIYDRFATRNDFHGGQIGLSGEYRWGNFIFDASGKVAFGVVRERVEIDGQRLLTSPGAIPVVSRGGLLAQPSNMGSVEDHRIAVVPEVGVSMGYQIGEHFRAFAGYTFLYMSNVARPGHAIDTSIGSANRPSRPNPGDDFWMQGVNLGLEVRY